MGMSELPLHELASDASLAAIELDDLCLGRPPTAFTYTNRVAEYLSGFSAKNLSLETQRPLVLWDSLGNPAGMQADDLETTTRALAQRLRAVPAVSAEDAREMRGYLVKLSNVALCRSHSRRY